MTLTSLEIYDFSAAFQIDSLYLYKQSMGPKHSAEANDRK